MDPAQQKKAVLLSTVELLMNQLKELERHLKSENLDSFESKMSELTDKRNEILMQVRELDLMERIRQKELEEKLKILEQKSLELDSQKRGLVKREIKLHSEIKEIKRKEAELHLEKKRIANLEEGFEIKKMMLHLKAEGFAGASSSRSKPSKSAVKMEAIQRKRRRAAASGSVKHLQTTVQDRDGLKFSLYFVKSHARSYMTVPGPFVSAYQDLSAKKFVILSSDKGDFRVAVTHYSSPRRVVHFMKGWRDFYTKNLLQVGSQCLFRLREGTVNGDASGFSMDVTVLDD